jgi:hypothetical protein
MRAIKTVKENFMRNRITLFGLIALVAIIGFSMAACDYEGPSDPDLEGTVSITGTAKETETLTAVTSGLKGEGNIIYQWQQEGRPGIIMSRTSTYSPVYDDVGKKIILKVERAGYSGSVTSAATEVVTAASTWTRVEIPAFGTGNNRSTVLGIAYGSNTYVAGGYGGKMATSPDVTTWTAVEGSPFGDAVNQSVRQIIWDGSKFIAVGEGGSKIATSDDGTDWTGVTTVPIETVTGIAYNGSNLYIAVGYSYDNGQKAEMATSTNGTDWTDAASKPFTGSINGIAWNGSEFIAWVGYQVATSTDGTTWTTDVTISTFSGSNIIRGIAWGGTTGQERFVAVGGGGKIVTSEDGTDWAEVTDSTFGASNINGIAWGGTTGQEKFVAVGVGGKMATSTDGETWTAVKGDRFYGLGTNEISRVAWCYDKFIATGRGTIAYSATGE